MGGLPGPSPSPMGSPQGGRRRDGGSGAGEGQPLTTLAIAWPHGVFGEEDSLAGPAQVHGGVS